jgi:hypothetical protein
MGNLSPDKIDEFVAIQAEKTLVPLKNKLPSGIERMILPVRDQPTRVEYIKF